MTSAQLIAALEQGLAFVRTVAPMAAVAGPVGAAAGAIATEIATFAGNALETATQGEAVIAANDLVTLNGLLAAIRAENDALAAQVAAS